MLTETPAGHTTPSFTYIETFFDVYSLLKTQRIQSWSSLFPEVVFSGSVGPVRSTSHISESFSLILPRRSHHKVWFVVSPQLTWWDVCESVNNLQENIQELFLWVEKIQIESLWRSFWTHVTWHSGQTHSLQLALRTQTSVHDGKRLDLPEISERIGSDVLN